MQLSTEVWHLEHEKYYHEQEAQLTASSTTQRSVPQILPQSSISSRPPSFLRTNSCRWGKLLIPAGGRIKRRELFPLTLRVLKTDSAEDALVFMRVRSWSHSGVPVFYECGGVNSWRQPEATLEGPESPKSACFRPAVVLT
jgi:hypothetical protein